MPHRYRLDIEKTNASMTSPYRFASSWEAVRRIQARFVPLFEGCRHVLDLGCGRGVFLELLRESGIQGQGIDVSDEAVSACQARNLLVVQQDALAFLCDQESKWDGIFCSHLVEHLSYSEAVALFRGCCGALAPDGVLVVVTPNTLDLRVICETFWLDPSHVRPYPLPLLVAMLADEGFWVSKKGAFSGGGWRTIGRRNLARHVALRLLLGPHYGHQNAYAVAHRDERQNRAQHTRDKGYKDR